MQPAEVAAAALDAGADMVNDVSALSDSLMAGLVAQRGCPICIMHMQGLPENMQDDPAYRDIVTEVRGALEVAATSLFEAGVDPNVVMADPGIGFGPGIGLSARHPRCFLLLGINDESGEVPPPADEPGSGETRSVYCRWFELSCARRGSCG